MNLDEDAELDCILAGVNFIEDVEANEESGISPELVRAVLTPTHDASCIQEMALREGRVGDTQLGEGSCQESSLSFSPLDLVTSAIKARFDQPGYEVYCKLEDLLVKGANDEDFGEELTFITDLYEDDFDSAQLEMQLKVMSSNLTQVPPNDLHSLLKYLRSILTSQGVLMCSFAV